MATNEHYLFTTLEEICRKPEPFERYTAPELWTNQHTSHRMLQYHLDDTVDAASRRRPFIARSVAWLVERFKVGTGFSIADFGCGPGLYATPLAERGASVTGIDFSGNSLRYAREVAAEKGLRIEYVEANYLDFDTDKRFDLIIMIMCDYCALSPEQRNLLLSSFLRFLKPGGKLLFDVYTLRGFEERRESAQLAFNHLDGFWSPNDYYCFVNQFKYDDVKVALDKYTIVDESGLRVVYNWLQYFSPESLSGELTAGGFAVDDFYANVAGDSFTETCTEMAVVATAR